MPFNARAHRAAARRSALVAVAVGRYSGSPTASVGTAHAAMSTDRERPLVHRAQPVRTGGRFWGTEASRCSSAFGPIGPPHPSTSSARAVRSPSGRRSPDWSRVASLGPPRRMPPRRMPTVRRRSGQLRLGRSAEADVRRRNRFAGGSCAWSWQGQSCQLIRTIFQSWSSRLALPHWTTAAPLAVEDWATPATRVLFTFRSL